MKVAQRIGSEVEVDVGNAYVKHGHDSSGGRVGSEVHYLMGGPRWLPAIRVSKTEPLYMTIDKDGADRFIHKFMEPIAPEM